MKRMQNKFALIAVGVALALALPTVASADETGGYLDVSVGRADTDDLDTPDFGWKFDAGTSFSLGAGYSFSKNVAVEARYIDFGDLDDNQPPIWTLSADALVVDFVARYPIGEQFSIFAKAGFFAWDAELTEAGFGELGSDDGTDLTFGFGASMSFTDNFGSYIQFKRYGFEVEGEDIDLDDISIGIQYRF